MDDEEVVEANKALVGKGIVIGCALMGGLLILESIMSKLGKIDSGISAYELRIRQLERHVERLSPGLNEMPPMPVRIVTE